MNPTRRAEARAALERARWSNALTMSAFAAPFVVVAIATVAGAYYVHMLAVGAFFAAVFCFAGYWFAREEYIDPGYLVESKHPDLAISRDTARHLTRRFYVTVDEDDPRYWEALCLLRDAWEAERGLEGLWEDCNLAMTVRRRREWSRSVNQAQSLITRTREEARELLDPAPVGSRRRV